MIGYAAILYSGGKDSHYALIKALEEGYNVKKLVVASPSREDSWMFHTVNVKWTALHADLLNIEYYVFRCSGIKDLEVDELKNELMRLRDEGLKYVITGVVNSNYQKAVIDDICMELGLTHITPLWGLNPYELLKLEVNLLGFIITAIQSYGLSPRWLGVKLDKNSIDEFLDNCIRYDISPVGEGGEYETFVTESPLFNGRKVCITSSRSVWNEYHWVGYLFIDNAVVC